MIENHWLQWLPVWFCRVLAFQRETDLVLRSAATREHLCRLQLLDVLGHHLRRQCQIVHLFEAESNGLQTPYQQNHPEMRLSEDAETPSIPLLINVSHSVPRNCNFEHPPIFREYQINKVHCRWFPLWKLFCVIFLRSQFLASSSFAQLVTQVSRANQQDDPKSLGALQYSNPTSQGRRALLRSFGPWKGSQPFWFWLRNNVSSTVISLISNCNSIPYTWLSNLSKTDNIGRTTICLAYKIKYRCRCPHQNIWTLGIYGRTWNTNVWEFQRHRVSVEAHA